MKKVTDKGIGLLKIPFLISWIPIVGIPIVEHTKEPMDNLVIINLLSFLAIAIIYYLIARAEKKEKDHFQK